MFKSGFFILLVFVLIIGYSCNEPERTLLTSEERALVDSLYSKNIALVKAEADSICEHINDEIYKLAVDSIKTIYINEITEILEGEG